MHTEIRQPCWLSSVSGVPVPEVTFSVDVASSTIARLRVVFGLSATGALDLADERALQSLMLDFLAEAVERMESNPVLARLIFEREQVREDLRCAVAVELGLSWYGQDIRRVVGRLRELLDAACGEAPLPTNQAGVAKLVRRDVELSMQITSLRSGASSSLQH